MFWGEKDAAHTRTGSQMNISGAELEPLEALVGEDAVLRDNGHIWHAGTAAKRLAPVDFKKRYMGLA